MRKSLWERERVRGVSAEGKEENTSIRAAHIRLLTQEIDRNLAGHNREFRLRSQSCTSPREKREDSAAAALLFPLSAVGPPQVRMGKAGAELDVG